jgi:hypothetical protein
LIGGVSTCTRWTPAGGGVASPRPTLLFDCRRSFLHLLDRARRRAWTAVECIAEAPRAFRELSHDGLRFETEFVDDRGADGHEADQQHARRKWSGDAQPFQACDQRIERVADQDAENDRNQHGLRVLQDEDQAQGRDNRQRRAANIQRNPNRRLLIRSVVRRRRRGRRLGHRSDLRPHGTNSSRCSA